MCKAQHSTIDCIGNSLDSVTLSPTTKRTTSGNRCPQLLTKGYHVQMVSARKRAGHNTSRIVCVGHHLRGIYHFLLLRKKVEQSTVLHCAGFMPQHPVRAKSRLQDLQSREVAY